MTVSITPSPGDPRLPASGSESAAAPVRAIPRAERRATLRDRALAAANRLVKRGVDIAISAALLVLLLPVLLLVAAVVRIDSPGPVLFRCNRTGYRGRSLRLLKFRKMACDAAG